MWETLTCVSSHFEGPFCKGQIICIKISMPTEGGSEDWPSGFLLALPMAQRCPPQWLSLAVLQKMKLFGLGLSLGLRPQWWSSLTSPSPVMPLSWGKCQPPYLVIWFTYHELIADPKGEIVQEKRGIKTQCHCPNPNCTLFPWLLFNIKENVERSTVPS